MIRHCFCEGCSAIAQADDDQAPGCELRCRLCGDDRVIVRCDLCDEPCDSAELVTVGDKVLCWHCATTCLLCGERPKTSDGPGTAYRTEVLCEGVCRTCAGKWTYGEDRGGRHGWFLIPAGREGEARAAIERGDTLPAPAEAP